MKQGSGGTAIVAGILAILLALLGVVGIVLTVRASGVLNDDDPYTVRENNVVGLVLVCGVQGLVALLWLLGGITLLNRKKSGPSLLIVLSFLSFLGGTLYAVVGLVTPDPAVGVGGVIAVLLAVLMLALILSKSCSRWCEEGRAPQHPLARGQLRNRDR
ncbi:hypothetical protein [Nocardia mexicana]|uniref:Uncharacterized protein n=1 Tax=Nocardia mexicana TaxID=279262 RepID=A0A370GXQ0_9NOCA|nr:hypothetical protein [Nocardia mexicana]RDI48437.1 hypothetical protein DFR68_108270 [Nocardia mexicana]